MNEYISREFALSCVDSFLSKTDMPIAAQYFYDCFRECEAADVQPVVHAYWTELPKALNPNENPCKCSNCGHVLSFMNYYPKSKYCDDCGARMDGDKE